MKFLSILCLTLLFSCKITEPTSFSIFFEREQVEKYGTLVDKTSILRIFSVEKGEGYFKCSLFPFFIEKREGYFKGSLFPFSIEKKKNYSKWSFFPFASRRLFRNRLTSYYLMYFYNVKDVTDPNSPYLSWFVPFYFQGRSYKGEDYIGFFPIYGTVRDIVGYESFKWLLFPLYFQTMKKDLKVNHFLWPIFYYGQNDELEKKGIFPLWLHSFKKDKYSKHSLIWPLIHFGYSKSPDSWWASFWPLFSLINQEKGHNYSFLWPFFSYKKSLLEERVHFLWPLLQYAQGFNKKGKVNRTYLNIFPFYSHSKGESYEVRRFLWPFFHWKKTDVKNYNSNSYMFFPIFYYMNREYKKKKNKNVYHHQIWPLYSYTHNPKKTSFAFPSLWSEYWQKDIYRVFSPFWTLYSHNREGEKVKKTFLFNFFTYRANKKDYKFSFFGDLFAIERKHGETDLTLFWFLKF